MNNGIKTYMVGAKNPAFGVEGLKEYRGTERGAKMKAGRIAKAAGHNWTPYFYEI